MLADRRILVTGATRGARQVWADSVAESGASGHTTGTTIDISGADYVR